jgi:hypothetical protein
VPYCSPDRVQRDFPESGDFEIYVDMELYSLDAYSPERARLETVYIVKGSKYVVGVYADETLGLAADTGTCKTCPNGATVCGHNPRCPKGG